MFFITSWTWNNERYIRQRYNGSPLYISDTGMFILSTNYDVNPSLGEE